ncbi:hypothetical protein [Sphingomonas faeni]|uniref:hypothetical protein n=1 Tax=Sphingomonas faeni TaxID=185950 RepID=UPI00278493FB|nr:hypothetical protein [Sphingomonas faeni]MDQ0838099.1 hypothetical protein [Sphingomonas faeni]
MSTWITLRYAGGWVGGAAIVPPDWAAARGYTGRSRNQTAGGIYHPAAGEGMPRQVGTERWRIERAERMAVIVDAADYFQTARVAMLGARRRILLIGKAFDARMSLEPGVDRPGEPSTLGAFMHSGRTRSRIRDFRAALGIPVRSSRCFAGRCCSR